MKILPTDLPGASKLFSDYIENFERIEQFYRVPYDDEKAILSHIDEIARREYPFEVLAKILTRQNNRFGAGPKTHENIARLKAGKAYVVITGQQVGLFGGPMYVLYKALTTIKLADRWSRLFEKCFVPVFWLAADDSDFEEVNHVAFLDKNFQSTSLQIEKTAPGNLPMSEILLGSQIEEMTSCLSDGLHDTEFKEDIFGHLQEAYSPERSMSEAFGCWLMHLLREFGLVLIDPTDPELKPLVSKIFVEEIESKSASTRTVLQTSKTLAEKGYSPQVPLREGRLNLFYLDGERKPLEFDQDRICTTDKVSAFSHEELLALASKSPERFSPNVILRAMTQDTLFPTIAYIAGPAEIGYFAQLQGVYEHFQIPMPVIFPRKSLTLIEPNIDRIIDKYNLSLEEIWGNIEQRITEFARQQLPESLTNELAEIKSKWPQALQELRSDVERVDPTLVKMLENTAGKIANTVDIFEKKIVQAGKRQNDIVSQQLHKVEAAVYPNNALQERVHNFTPYLVKYGPLFVERIYEVLDIASYHHQVVRL